MFKDRYFQSSEILQNAVKCIDHVEGAYLEVFQVGSRREYNEGLL